MMPTFPRTRRSLRGLAVLALAAVTACEERLSPRFGGIGQPPITVPTGAYDLVEVNDDTLPHSTSASDTTSSLVSGSLALNADSTWLFSTVERLSVTSTGAVIRTSPAQFSSGTWNVTGSTVNMRQNQGTITVKGDSLFWTGGPEHDWDDIVKYTLVKR
jgi:hypothetical protein